MTQSMAETSGAVWTQQEQRQRQQAGWPMAILEISQIIGKGVEALPLCGKEAWGDGDTGKDN